MDKDSKKELGTVVASSIIGAASGSATNKIISSAEKAKDEAQPTIEEHPVIETAPEVMQPAINDDNLEAVVIVDTLDTGTEQQSTETSTPLTSSIETLPDEEQNTIEVEIIEEDIVAPYEELEEIMTVYGGPPIENEEENIDIDTLVYGGPTDDLDPPFDEDMVPGIDNIMPDELLEP